MGCRTLLKNALFGLFMVAIAVGIFVGVWMSIDDRRSTLVAIGSSPSFSSPSDSLEAAASSCGSQGVYAPISSSSSSSKCVSGSSNLGIGCNISVLNAPSRCVGQNSWSLQVTSGPEVTLPQTPTAVCSSSSSLMVTRTIEVIRLDNDLLYLMGTASVTISNEGSINTTLASLALALERATSVAGMGNSYGPGGKNFELVSVAAVENQATTSACSTSNEIRICNKGSCNVALPVTLDTLKTVSDSSSSSLEAGEPLNLMAYVFPARSPCGRGARTLKFTYLLPVTQEMVDDYNNPDSMSVYYLSAFATYNTGCARSSNGCGIDLDCDGKVDSVSTISLRSEPLQRVQAPALDCAKRCSCVTANELLGDLTSLSLSSACLSSVEVDPLSTQLPQLICESTTIPMSSKACCDTKSCDCVYNAENTWINTLPSHVTLSAPQSTASECYDPVTGNSLVTGQADIHTEFSCTYPASVDCFIYSWGTWTPTSTCSSRSDGTCARDLQRTRAVRTACHGGEPCPAGTATVDGKLQTCGCDYQNVGWGVWTEWSPACSSIVRTQTRTRLPLDDPTTNPCGVCEVQTESFDCLVIPCVYSTWSIWSTCQSVDGVSTSGTQSRSRSLTNTPTFPDTCTTLAENNACTVVVLPPPPPLSTGGCTGTSFDAYTNSAASATSAWYGTTVTATTSFPADPQQSLAYSVTFSGTLVNVGNLIFDVTLTAYAVCPSGMKQALTSYYIAMKEYSDASTVYSFTVAGTQSLGTICCDAVFGVTMDITDEVGAIDSASGTTTSPVIHICCNSA